MLQARFVRINCEKALILHSFKCRDPTYVSCKLSYNFTNMHWLPTKSK